MFSPYNPIDLHIFQVFFDLHTSRAPPATLTFNKPAPAGFTGNNSRVTISSSKISASINTGILGSGEDCMRPGWSAQVWWSCLFLSGVPSLVEVSLVWLSSSSAFQSGFAVHSTLQVNSPSPTQVVNSHGCVPRKPVSDRSAVRHAGSKRFLSDGGPSTNWSHPELLVLFVGFF